MSLPTFCNAQCAAPGVGVVNTLVSTLVQALLTAQCNITSPDYWPPDYGDIALQKGLDSYDFVVIGAGSAGSVVASRLSENPNWNVLVLEAGGDPPQESEVPSLLFTIQHTNYTWNYLTEPNGRSCLAMKQQACYWPRGKMIGGSGAINAMLYVRGNRRDYDNWMQQGNTNWGWDDVLPYFEKSVRAVGNTKHPQGYVTLNEFEKHDVDVQDLIRAGAVELGVPLQREFTDGHEIGYANLPGTVKNGQRMSTGKGYLGKVSARPNLQVIKNAQVTHLKLDTQGESVETIEFVLREKYKMRVHVGKEVVLSAGTIDSAKLLLMSGIGPADHLRDLQLPVVHDLDIGLNLQDHLLVPVFFQLNMASIAEKATLDNIYNYLIHKRGPLASHGTISLTGFLNTADDGPYPDVENHHLFFRRGDLMGLQVLLSGLDINEQFSGHIRELLENTDLLIIWVLLSHPKSSGKLELRSTDYKDKPRIYTNYLKDPVDVETLLRGLRHLLKTEHTKAYKSYDARIAHIPIPECDVFEFKSDAYWRCYMKYFTSTTYHPTGTVKMGPLEDPSACVDPTLLLHGVENLRVADASIMPSVPSANTNAATIMIAERAADFIKIAWLGVNAVLDEEDKEEKEDCTHKSADDEKQTHIHEL